MYDTHCTTLQHTATHVLFDDTAPHCNTLQHTATQVLFDDTWAGAAPGLYNGKGGRAVGYLMAKGFEIVRFVNVYIYIYV